jgi:hypothetical protein
MARWPRAEVGGLTGRSNALLDGLKVDILSVPDFEDRDFASIVVNELDNAVVALTDPITIGIAG